MCRWRLRSRSTHGKAHNASNSERKTLLTIHRSFNELERRHIADSDPNWRWCLNPSCDHGQIHITASDPTPRKPALATRRKLLFVSTPEHESANLPQDNCTCDECGSIACVPCDRPWHEGESCAEFQVRVKNRMDEEDQSLALIRKAMKKCPECSRSIEKNGGCPSMHCSQCGASFCWNCLKTYTRGLCGCGRGQT
jgi:ariadne-1